jgi:hypothetical protein
MKLEIPELFLVAKEVALLSPSSAMCERVFSMLSQGFSSNQDSALEDYKATSVMLRYNNIMRK